MPRVSELPVSRLFHARTGEDPIRFSGLMNAGSGREPVIAEKNWLVAS